MVLIRRNYLSTPVYGILGEGRSAGADRARDHPAQDFRSGVRILGKLLASRGILASVDENSLNGSHYDIFKGPARTTCGWLLLNLQVWQEWNAREDTPYEKGIWTGLPDWSFEGGEAAAHAALFNRLPYYPDNANECLISISHPLGHCHCAQTAISAGPDAYPADRC